MLTLATLAGKAVELVVKYPLQWIIVFLLVGNLTTYNLWQKTEIKLTKEQAAHVETVQNFKVAQEVANARAEVIRTTLKKEAEANAKRADANYASLLSKYNASILRYQASQSNTRRPSDYQLPAPKGGDGPGRSSLISITMTDAQICAVNTARLQSVHEWAVNLPTE